MVIPAVNIQDEGTTEDFPPEIQFTLESAVQRKRHVTQTKITDFTTEKRQEFKSWRDETRKQAKIIAKVAETVSIKPSRSAAPASKVALSIPSIPSGETTQASDLFPKSPVTQHAQS